MQITICKITPHSPLFVILQCMKAALWCFLLLLSATNSTTYAQCPSNMSQLEIAASYGLVTGDRFAAGFNNNEKSEGKTVTSTSGNMFLSVRYFLFNRLALGLCGGRSTENGQYTDRANPAFISRTYSSSTTTVALELYYIYSFRKYLEIYTIAGVGPSSVSSDETTYAAVGAPGITKTFRDNNLKIQYTPVGVRFGGRLGGFVELGVGYKGLINGGISYKFGSPCWWSGR